MLVLFGKGLRIPNTADEQPFPDLSDSDDWLVIIPILATGSIWPPAKNTHDEIGLLNPIVQFSRRRGTSAGLSDSFKWMIGV
jgi:hypothetical protein